MRNLPISVIVVARNAERTIEDCLISICRNKPAEIIVVDGNSSDRTVQIAREYTERIFSDSDRGLNYARQLGAERATQEYISYIDSDVVLIKEALATMLAEFQGSEYISIVAQEAPHRKFLHYWEWAQYQHNQLRHVEGRIGLMASVFKREMILKYGFDLSERDLDDVDLEIRMSRDGYKFGTSSALYYHRYRANLKSLVKYRFFLGRVTTRYIRKYGLWHTDLWPPLATAYWLGFCMIKGKPKLIPYCIVDGIAKTAGTVKGLFEIVAEKLGKSEG